ncbi:LPXTG cell wall anchor domain-containing protein, partial [Gemella sanguinis]|uniref:Spy0128 family protein n=1 Tax=Gemella sanguinis TaxID=84135 RepID=UPI00352DBC5D
LKDSEGNTLQTVSNDAEGNVKFKALEFKKGQEGVHKYTVEEVAGTDATVSYDAMKAEVTVTVSHDGTAKVLVVNVTDAPDKEFNNTVRPPETPEFNPEKYILNEKEFDLTGTKLLDDDSELTDKVADTNKDPYADKANNNEAQNINTKTLKKGDQVVYQVWLDTTKFNKDNKDYIQSVGVTDKYDSENLDINVADIKAYDSVTGEDVTAKFDIKVENGVITATSKVDLTKSLGDAENTPVIDTDKLAFGRYYKFDIPATIKATAKDGVDIENTASQTVHQYDPTKKSVEKPEKPTETRVVNIPTKVEFNFTKKLEGRQLKEGEFSFVLKDKDGNVIETVKNDAAGNIKFSALEFKRGEEGTYTYTVEEVKGTEAGVVYDKMVATVTVTVTKEGKVLTATSQLPEDTEFNNKVTPPSTPPTTPPTTPPSTPPTPPKPLLPNTGEESTSGALAGFGTLLAGIALAVRRRKDEE